MSFITDLFSGATERDAAQAREAGFTEGTEELRRQFDLTRGDFAPGIERGDVAGEEEAALLGLRGSEAEQAAIGRFSESPGQAFLRQRSERALLRNESAIGGLGGGNVRTALSEQAIGFGAQFLGERKNRLAGVASRGLNAVATQAGIGANISGNIANLLTGRGEARGAGIENVASARRSGLARIAGAFI